MDVSWQTAHLMGVRKLLCRVLKWDAAEAAIVAVAVLACVNALVEFWRWISTPPM